MTLHILLFAIYNYSCHIFQTNIFIQVSHSLSERLDTNYANYTNIKIEYLSNVKFIRFTCEKLIPIMYGWKTTIRFHIHIPINLILIRENNIYN